MSIIGLVMNLLLATLLLAALGMGWRLNGRLKALRDSHEGFAVAVRELNTAAARAEQGLADLRAATDEAVDLLADRIDKGRTIAARLGRLLDDAASLPAAATPLVRPQPTAPPVDMVAERRLGALLAAAREARPPRPERFDEAPRREPPPSLERVRRDPLREMAAAAAARRLAATAEDDLFEDEPLTLDVIRGAAR
jgi:hypothetical protein